MDAQLVVKAPQIVQAAMPEVILLSSSSMTASLHVQKTSVFRRKIFVLSAQLLAKHV
jgi:hypothetical protein